MLNALQAGGPWTRQIPVADRHGPAAPVRAAWCRAAGLECPPQHSRYGSSSSMVRGLPGLRSGRTGPSNGPGFGSASRPTCRPSGAWCGPFRRPPGCPGRRGRTEARGQNPPGIRATMHPGWPLRLTYPRCKVYITLCHVYFTCWRSKASLCVAPRTNSPAIHLSSRLASPAPRRSRCSRGFIHGLLASFFSLIQQDAHPGQRHGQIHSAFACRARRAPRTGAETHRHPRGNLPHCRGTGAQDPWEDHRAPPRSARMAASHPGAGRLGVRSGRSRRRNP